MEIDMEVNQHTEGPPRKKTRRLPDQSFTQKNLTSLPVSPVVLVGQLINFVCSSTIF
jgi:hypothetical protein